MVLILLLSLLTLLFYYLRRPPSPFNLSARAESFLDGVPLQQTGRLKVKAISVAGKSVAGLFQNLDTDTLSPLTIKDTNALKELRQALEAKPSPRIEVLLEDLEDYPLVRKWYEVAQSWLKVESYEEWKRYPIYIDVVQTPCAEARHLVLEKIESAVRERTKVKQAGKEIDLDDVFNRLLNDSIVRYLDTLEDVAGDSECSKTVQLRRWLKGEEIAEYISGTYEVVENLRLALDPVLEVLEQARAEDDRYKLQVKVVGYTDAVPVTGTIILSEDGTGVDDWTLVRRPPEVFYSRCAGNNMTVEEPAYARLNEGGETRVTRTIRDNCELGAARAYTAAVYMLQKLRSNGVEYDYATGGVSRDARKKVIPDAGTNTRPDDPKARKVSIKFILNTAAVSE
jgi:hypothetical protein